MRRSAAIPLLASALLALAGCKSPCRELSERLCGCLEQFQQDRCIQQVADRERSIEPTDADLAACEAHLDECLPPGHEDLENQSNQDDGVVTCVELETDAGKLGCGLAR
jgi:hypothetical protein